MNNILKVSKYQLRDAKLAVLIYYTIVILIDLLMIMTYFKLTSNSDRVVSFGGLGFSSIVFIFVSGLNCFKASFKFLQANNVSRKRFFIANIITFACLAVFMAAIDLILDRSLNLIVPYDGIFKYLYQMKNSFAEFIWTSAILVLASAIGWLITMLYYRSSNLLKLFISFSPVLLITLMVFFNRITKGAITAALANFITKSMGLINNNPYAAVMSFAIAYLGVIGLCYLLIRRAPIKD